MEAVIIVAIVILVISRLVGLNTDSPRVFWYTQIIDVITIVALVFTYLVNR